MLDDMHPIDEHEGLELLLWSTQIGLSCVFLVTTYVAVQARKRVGTPLVNEPASWVARGALLCAAALLALWVVLRRDDVPLAATIGVLAVTALIAVVRPAFGDAVYGERGVRHGWHARTFEQIEEWRLAGEHLRWRIGTEWLACRVPVEMQPALRAKLLALCPERESTFSK